jgi:nucleoside-diphosphate kinase
MKSQYFPLLHRPEIYAKLLHIKRRKNMAETRDNYVERTLVVFKPDSIQRGIVGEILSRFERVGLKIVAVKMIAPGIDHYNDHYETIGKLGSRKGEVVLNSLIEFMTDGPVIAMVLEGLEAIEVVRKIVGPTEPKAADMGTIRGDYSHISFGYTDSVSKAITNLIHASADANDAAAEISLWFNDDEICDYSILNEKFTR